jgi:hypothetical protein
MDHQFSASKDRTGLFDGRIEKLTEKTGAEIKHWLNSGKTVSRKNKHDLLNALLAIHKEDDKLAASEFWASISREEKTEVFPLLGPTEQKWLKELLAGAPK